MDSKIRINNNINHKKNNKKKEKKQVSKLRINQPPMEMLKKMRVTIII